MKVLIVDDEKPARDRLARMLLSLLEYELVGMAADGQEAVQWVDKTGAEIVLMDIRMPGLDGIQAARHLSEMSHPPAVIFTTAYGDHALEAFTTHATDYLLKPIKKTRLQAALQAAQKPTRAQIKAQKTHFSSVQPRQHICTRVRGNLTLVKIEDIYYFQADQKYVTVRHRQGEALIEDTLKQIEQEFSEWLIRIHRNTLVNSHFLAGIETRNNSRSLWLKEIDQKLEVSRRHLPAIRKLIKKI